MKVKIKALFIFSLFVIINSCVFSANKISQEVKNEFVNACRKGDISKVEAMLKQGIDPNVADINGFFGLIVASVNGNLNLVKLLIKYGANINKKYKGNVLNGLEGETALTFLITSWDWASTNSQKYKLEQVANYLVDHGIDLNYKNSLGFNYLMIAAKEGMTPLIKKLIEKGMDVNAQSPEGATALMLASLNGHTDTVKFLLEHGANPNLKVKSGQYKGYTALKFAKEKGYKDIVKLLKQYGAKE